MSLLFDPATTPIGPGTTVIEASAGTGKTYCLTGLVLRLLLEGRVSAIGRVLVMTFTHAASDELTGRLRQTLGDAERLFAGEGSTDDPFLRAMERRHRGPDAARVLRRALLELDELGVFTIHGFCRRLLEAHAFESGVPFEPRFIDDDETLLVEAARDFWRRRLYPAGALVAAAAAVRGWTPETFLDAYRTWRRHPHTRLLPEAPTLDAAAAGLAAAGDGVVRVYDRDASDAFLASLAYTKKGARAVAPGGREALLDALDAFCRDRHPAGLEAALGLAAGRLAEGVFKKDKESCRRHPLARACEALSTAVDRLEDALRSAFITEVDALFDAAKRDAAALDFDDLLGRVHAALAHPERGAAFAAAAGADFEAVLVDEFQDTDLVQYEIFRRLFRRRPLVLVGDPKQAIYRFRGADVFAYVAARDEADRVFTLERNWRSDPALVAATNALFSRAPRGFVFPEIPFAPATAAAEERLEGDGGKPLEWLWLPPLSSKHEALRQIERTVAGEVVRLLESGARFTGPSGDRALEPADLAVLTRTNEQAQRMLEALRRARVPAVLGRAGDVFASDEMAELEAVLAAIVDPARRRGLRAAWATRLWGDDAAALRRAESDERAFDARLELVEDLRRRWRRRGFMAMVQELLERRDVRRRWLAAEGGERRLTNLLHAAEMVHGAIVDRHLSPAGLLAWLARERRSGRTHDAEAAELRLESDARAVEITTIHKSKGLEYGVVFCPFLWDAQPERRAPAVAHVEPRRVVLDFGSDDFDRHLELAEAERLAEDLRLAYVAVTRARHRAVLAWGEIGSGWRTSALAYLLRPAEGDGEGDPAARVKRALDGLRGTGARRGLDELVGRHGRVMALREVGDEAPPTLRRRGGAGPGELVRPELPGDLGRRLVPWRMVSFTSLARGRDSEAPDHADPDAPAAEASGGEERPAGGMFAFARGARAGTCLHEILERCELAAPDGEASRRQIAASLRRWGLDRPERHRGTGELDPDAAVAAMLERVTSTPLPGAGFRLRDVEPGGRLPEWRFHAPLADVSPRRLAEVFRAHGEGHVGELYPASLERLSPRAARGFLTGFVDLVFTHEERWYVVDWKSNHLGDAARAYRPAALGEVMRRHHYVLQYHLYALALDRYLRHRLPGYDPGRHLGGVFYVFLRGAAASDDGEAGWYADRPPPGLLAALGELVGGSPSPPWSPSPAHPSTSARERGEDDGRDGRSRAGEGAPLPGGGARGRERGRA